MGTDKPGILLNTAAAGSYFYEIKIYLINLEASLIEINNP
jgi:hypothetical protein